MSLWLFTLSSTLVKNKIVHIKSACYLASVRSPPPLLQRLLISSSLFNSSTLSKGIYYLSWTETHLSDVDRENQRWICRVIPDWIHFDMKRFAHSLLIFFIKLLSSFFFCGNDSTWSCWQQWHGFIETNVTALDLHLIPFSLAWAGPVLSVGCTCLQETSPGPPRGSSPLLLWLWTHKQIHVKQSLRKIIARQTHSVIGS